MLCEKHYPFPPNHGRATRIVTLARDLRGLGFDATVLVCEGPATDLPDGTRVRTIPLSTWPLRDIVLWSVLRRVNRERRVDFFQVQNDVLVVAGLLARLAGFRVHYDAQVVESDYWSALRPRTFRETASSVILPLCERILCLLSERISVLSEHDAARLQAVHGLPPGKVFVVPLSARRSLAPGPAAIEAERRPVVLFLGSYEHRPNVDAIDLLGKEIRPRVLRRVPDAVFRVVGKGLPVEELRAQGLEVHSDVDDVTPLIDSATVCVAPVRVGSGVRTKLLEYMSRGRPVVAMTPALEGLPVTPGVDLLVADELDAFADRIVALLQDPGLRGRIGASGLERIQGVTGPEAVAKALSAFYAG